MKVRWNGHSSFTITAADGMVIVTDPYEPGAFGGGIGYRKIDVRPDIVTISHDHADHNYLDGFSGAYEAVRAPKTVRGIDFKAVDVFHDGNGGKQRGPNRIFIFTVDGVTVCHLGDLGHVPDAGQVSKIGKVDVLLIPVGGFYTIDHRQATEVVKLLAPRIAIPMHFKTAKCGFPIAPVTEFTAGKKNVKVLNVDEIELTGDSLPGATEIIVLKHQY